METTSELEDITYKYPKWTRQDFKIVANIIRELRRKEAFDLVLFSRMLDLVVDRLRHTNNNFDEYRFKEACGAYDDNENEVIRRKQLKK